MAYTINITETLNTVTTTVVNNTVTVSVEEIAVNATATNVTIGVTNQLNTVTVYTDAIELRLEDLTNFFKGDWVSGATYQRGDLVNSAYSLYISIAATYTEYVSTILPSIDTTHWNRIVWHEAPFDHITVTNTATILGDLNVGGGVGGNGLTISSTATFNGRLIVNNTATFNGIANFNTVTNIHDLYINGLRFPPNKGNYGQILYTNGTNQALWSDINDLLYWYLSDDLHTVGYNIVTGHDALVPNPRLIIGSGVTGNFVSSLDFALGGSTATLSAPRVIVTSTNASLIVSGTNATLNGDTVELKANGDSGLKFTSPANAQNGLTVQGGSNLYGNTVINNGIFIHGTSDLYDTMFVDGTIRGTEEYTAGKYTSLIKNRGYIGFIDDNIEGPPEQSRSGSGIIFSDGTILTSASAVNVGYTGSRGYTGSAGTNGTNGSPGSPGATGYTGSAGAYAGMGYTGSAGPQGPTGQQGPGGNDGYTGSRGPQGPAGGYTGSAGQQGPSGPIGYTGSSVAGPTGPSGPMYSAPNASTSTVGVVKIGTNIDVNTTTGVISVATATTATVGVVRVGSGITVDANGIISVPTTAGSVSLSSNMQTNGYPIQYYTASPHVDNKLTIDADKTELSWLHDYKTRTIRLDSTGTTILTVFNTASSTATFTESAIGLQAPEIELKGNYLYLKSSNYTVLGSNIYNSRLQVSEITSYSGTGPVQFVHGIQFDDNTTQITAWRPNELNIVVVDFGSI
jgi:hypothetical protein